MIIPNIWENKKCSKPPTRLTSLNSVMHLGRFFSLRRSTQAVIRYGQYGSKMAMCPNNEHPTGMVCKFTPYFYRKLMTTLGMLGLPLGFFWVSHSTGINSAFAFNLDCVMVCLILYCSYISFWTWLFFITGLYKQNRDPINAPFTLHLRQSVCPGPSLPLWASCRSAVLAQRIFSRESNYIELIYPPQNGLLVGGLNPSEKYES